MYGTIAKMRLKPGAEALLLAWTDPITNAVKEHGWVSTTIYKSDEEPLVCWLAVVFESREAYRANAESPGQDVRYRRLRACLEDDPEWHDGEVVATRSQPEAHSTS